MHQILSIVESLSASLEPDDERLPVVQTEAVQCAFRFVSGSQNDAPLRRGEEGGQAGGFALFVRHKGEFRKNVLFGNAHHGGSHIRFQCFSAGQLGADC